MKKLLALLLALVMVFAMVACAAEPESKDDDEDEKTEEKTEAKTKEEQKTQEQQKTQEEQKTEQPTTPPAATGDISGDWVAAMSAGSVFEAMFSETLPGLDQYLDYDTLLLEGYLLKLNADGSFSLSADEAKLTASADELIDSVIDGVMAYCQANNINKTRAELEAALDGAADSLLQDTDASTGTWTYANDVLTLTVSGTALPLNVAVVDGGMLLFSDETLMFVCER